MSEQDPNTAPTPAEDIEWVPRPELQGRFSLARRVARLALRLDHKYGHGGWVPSPSGKDGMVQVLVRKDRVNGYERPADEQTEEK